MIEYKIKEIEILKRRNGSCFLLGGVSLKQRGKKIIRFKFEKGKGVRILSRRCPEVRAILPDLSDKLEALTT